MDNSHMPKFGMTYDLLQKEKPLGKGVYYGNSGDKHIVLVRVEKLVIGYAFQIPPREFIVTGLVDYNLQGNTLTLPRRVRKITFPEKEKGLVDKFAESRGL